MKLSENWLREWVNPAISSAELAHQLTMAGVAVENILPAAPPLEGIVSALVMQVERHPNADKLHLCTVNVGSEPYLNVVCGAPNVRAGMKVACACIGAKLANGMRIKKTKIRGVESVGMLCSTQELGLTEDSDGLLELFGQVPLGMDIRTVLQLHDSIFEFDITPNRGDCLSVLGISREIAVLNAIAFKQPTIRPVTPQHDQQVSVAIADSQACPHYLGRVITGIDASIPSPLWLREKLRRSGLRSINVVVDISNYVLLELGQPMHAFDLDKLQGAIQVRQAQAGESLLLLNGHTVSLKPDTLVIADNSGPVAMAGVMGGKNTGVDSSAKNILLESAYFSPAAVARKGRQYGVYSDSLQRFERGVDRHLQKNALERASSLILELCSGQAGPIVEKGQGMPAEQPITLRYGQIQRCLGISLAPQEIENLLTRLEIKLNFLEEQQIWQATVPSHRFDLIQERDLIEEIARIHGYEQIPATSPVLIMGFKAQPAQRVELNRITQTLMDRGFSEAMSYSFLEGKLLQQLEQSPPILLKNPLSRDMSHLRTTLWAGLLQGMSYNLRRQQNRVRLYETGLIFHSHGDDILQEYRIAAVATGSVGTEQWIPCQQVDFFLLKGDLEAILGLTGRREDFIFREVDHPALQPGQSAQIFFQEKAVGWIGKLSLAVQQTWDITQAVYVFEINRAVFDQARLPIFREISRFPHVRRDLALVVADHHTAESILSLVRQEVGEILLDLTVFDVYRGKGISSGHKSIGIGMIFQHHERTLTDSEIEHSVTKVVQILGKKLGASLRE